MNNQENPNMNDNNKYLYEKSIRIKGYGFSEKEERQDLSDKDINKAKGIVQDFKGNKVYRNVVNNLQDFINVIDTLDANHESPCFFRGHTNANFLLNPASLRENVENENKIIEEFERYFPKECHDCYSVMDKLVYMQHYGLRTRCLDLSENPLIALYFACKDMVKFRNDTIGNKDKWGEVLIFKEQINNDDIKNNYSSTTSIIANTALMDEEFSLEKFQMFYKNDGHLSFDEKYISFRDLVSRSVIVRTPKMNERIRNQQGAFILVNANEFVNSPIPNLTELVLNDKDFNVFKLNRIYKRKLKGIKIGQFSMKKIKPYSLDNKHEIFKNDPFDINRLLYRDENNMQVVILIPPKAKETILKQLERLNITEDFVYPEMDSIAYAINNRFLKSKEEQQQ